MIRRARDWRWVALAGLTASLAAWADDELHQLASRVAAETIHQQAQAPLALWTEGADAAATRAFTTLLSAELSRVGLTPRLVAATGAREAEQHARDEGDASLLRITLEKTPAQLTARGDLLSTWVNFWSGASLTRAAEPAAAIEISLATAPPAVSFAQVDRAGSSVARLPEWAAALATGDVDGDGRSDIAVLTDSALLVLAPDGKLLTRYDLGRLPRSPAAPREAVGTLAIASVAGEPRIFYFSAAHGSGEQLVWDREARSLRAAGAVTAPTFGGGATAEWIPGENAFRNLKVPAKERAPAATFVTLSVRTIEPAHMLQVAADGEGVFRQGAIQRTLPALGAGSALVDLRGDGFFEVVTSSDAFAPNPDSVRVLQVAALGEPLLLWQAPAPGRVVHIAPLQTAGQAEEDFVTASWMPDGTTELTVFRRQR